MIKKLSRNNQLNYIKCVSYTRPIDGSDAHQILAPVTDRLVMPTKVNPDGTGMIPLTSTTATTRGIAGNWSPDGSRVAYIHWPGRSVYRKPRWLKLGQPHELFSGSPCTRRHRVYIYN